MPTVATDFGVMDDLTYSYTGNQLKAVDDDIASSATQGFVDGAELATEYTYDDNGNVLTDANKGIIDIDYNYWDLPILVDFGGGNKIEYIYDAYGNKLKKKVADITNGNKETDYAGNHIYENSTLKFFTHAEGYVQAEGNGIFSYVYQYKDHLGNVRLSYSDNNNDGSVDSSEIIEEKNYYPFGLIHKGYNMNINGIQNNYLTYNGKEFDISLNMNMYDLGARMYDPAIGRFMNIDPMADFVNYQSPYVMADNNPIYFVDEYGLKKCGWFCRTFNNLVFGKKNVFQGGGNKGRRKKGRSRSTSLVYSPSGPNSNGSNKDDDDDSETGSTRININSSDFATIIAGISGPKFPPIFANPLKTPKGPNPRRDRIFRVPTAGQSLTTPVNIRFTGDQGTTLNRNHPVSQRTLTALLATLTGDPNLSILISSNYFTTGSTAWPAAQRRGNAQNSARANAIRAFLEHHGIDPSRINIGQGTLNQQTRTQQTAGQRSNQNITITKNQ